MQSKGPKSRRIFISDELADYLDALNLAKGYLQGLYGALPSLGGEMVYDE